MSLEDFVWGMSDFQRTCEANPASENGSVIFRVCLKPVSFYYFKLAYVVLHMVVKTLSKTTSKNGEIDRFNLEIHFDQL